MLQEFRDVRTCPPQGRANHHGFPFPIEGEEDRLAEEPRLGIRGRTRRTRPLALTDRGFRPLPDERPELGKRPPHAGIDGILDRRPVEEILLQRFKVESDHGDAPGAFATGWGGVGAGTIPHLAAM